MQCTWVILLVTSEIFSNAFEDILIEGFGVGQLEVSYLSWYRVGLFALCIFELFLILPKHLVEIKLASIFSFFSVLTFIAYLCYILLSGRS